MSQGSNLLLRPRGVWAPAIYPSLCHLTVTLGVFILSSSFFALFLQAVQMFIDERISYLDIMKLNEACCEAHKKDLVSRPSLEEIVHYDQWARR